MGQKESVESKEVKPTETVKYVYINITNPVENIDRNMRQEQPTKIEELRRPYVEGNMRQEQPTKIEELRRPYVEGNMRQKKPTEAKKVEQSPIQRNMRQEQVKKTEEVKETLTHGNEKNIKSIRVESISGNATSKDLENYFSNFGQVVRTSMTGGVRNGAPFHCGLKSFASEACAQKALAHRNHVLLGKAISVQPYHNNNRKEILENEGDWIAESSENRVKKNSTESEPLENPKKTVKKFRKKKNNKHPKSHTEKQKKNEAEKEEHIETDHSCSTVVSQKLAAPIPRDRRALIADSIRLIMNVSEEVKNKLKIKENSQLHNQKKESTGNEFVNLVDEFSSVTGHNLKVEENLIDFDDEKLEDTIEYIVNSFERGDEGNFVESISQKSDDTFTCALCNFSCPISSYNDIFHHSNTISHKNMLKRRFQEVKN